MKPIMKPIQQQTVLVTGASRGIGAAVALRFAKLGMRVVIHYCHSHADAIDMANSCKQLGVEVMTVPADLQSKSDIQGMMKTLENSNFLPDILINNAGISHVGVIDELTEDTWDSIMNVNLKGAFLCTQAFMFPMIKQKFGRIINVSSVWGLTGASCEVAYSTAKGGLNTFTKALAKELAPSGITVNAVAPGAVDTDMLSVYSNDEKQQLVNQIPMRRLATTDEIAALIVFLALPDSSYITGQIISPNGGWLM
jgi:3-oxoacyl-[acyl-carrier protein] reductase